MTDINSITIGGRITSDITERDYGYLSTGTAKLTIHIACNKSVKKGNEWTEQTSFFDAELWGKLAEAMSQKIYKGLDVIITGSLKQDRWQDAQTGQNRSTIKITVDNIRTYPKQTATQSAPQQNYQQPAPQFVPQNVPQNQQRLQIQSVEQNQQDFPEDYPPEWDN